MKQIEQDILKVKTGIIGHQVNCQGKMGAGLALEIARKWPRAKEAYLEAMQSKYLSKEPLMGSMTKVKVSGPDLFVAHLFGQNYYGRGKQHTNYSALGSALHRLYHSSTSGDRVIPVYLPHGLGCGLAGGDWDKVLQLIENNCPDAIICKLP